MPSPIGRPPIAPADSRPFAPGKTAIRRRAAPIVAGLIILVGIALRIQDGLSYPIEQPHDFRQTHVASVIEVYMAEGLSVPARPGNRLLDAVYDFPLYQFVVAVAAGAIDALPVPTARAVNILLYATLSALVVALIRQVQAGWTRPIMTIALMAAALTCDRWPDLSADAGRPVYVFLDRQVSPDEHASWSARHGSGIAASADGTLFLLEGECQDEAQRQG